MTAFTKPILWGPNLVGIWDANDTDNTSTFNSTFGLSDADNAIAMLFCAPKDGTIDTVGLHINAVNGNPPAYYAGLVTIDTSTGVPNTAAYGGSAIESYDFTSTGWVWITLATPATANAGDLVAMRVWPTGTAPDGSNNVSVTVETLITSKWPEAVNYTTNWNHYGAISTQAVRYSTGEIVGLPVVGYLYGSINSGTTPDEFGDKFTLPTTMKCVGARVFFRILTANATFSIKLYDNADNVIASIGALDEDVINGGMIADFYWDEVTLTSGATYRITVLPGTTTNVTVSSLDFESNTSHDNALPTGSSWVATYRTDAGAWTDDASAIVFINLLVSDMTLASSSGGAYGFVG